MMTTRRSDGAYLQEKAFKVTVPHIGTRVPSGHPNWHKALAWYYSGKHGRSEPVLQYGYEDCEGSLHLFLQFDTSRCERVQTSAKLQAQMLEVFAPHRSGVCENKYQGQIAVAKLGSAEAKLFCLCSLAYNRLLQTERYGGGLDLDLGDIGGLGFESLMTALHLSHAVTVRRAVTGAGAAPPSYVLDSSRGEDEWSLTAGAQRFHGVGAFLDKLYGEVKTNDDVDPGASWVYLATVRSLYGDPNHRAIRDCFLKSGWLNDFRVCMVIQPDASDLYHVLLVPNMPLTVSEMRNHWGEKFSAGVGSGAVLEDFIPVSAHNDLDVAGDLFACASLSYPESVPVSHKHIQTTGRFYENHRKTVQNACAPAAPGTQTKASKAGSHTKEEYLAQEPFKSMKSRTIHGKLCTEFLTTSHFHLKVFDLHAKVESFTDRYNIGRLSLITSANATSTSTYSNKHDSSRPRRVYFSSGPAAPLPPPPPPMASRDDDDEDDASSGAWMQGFLSSPSSSSSASSPSVVSSAAVLMLPARIGAGSGSGKLPAWRPPVLPAAASPVDSEEPAPPSQAAPVVSVPQPVVVSLPQPVVSLPQPAVVAAAGMEAAAPVVVVVQSWGLGTGKHRSWPVLSVVSPPVIKAEPVVSPSEDCGVSVVDHMAVSNLVNSAEEILPLPLPLPLLGMPPCKTHDVWRTSSQSVDVCRGPSGGYALAGDPRRHRPARV
jgi:hypothetical protein